ncbi:MAG: DUF2075 domain-containing protein [Gemmatimonadetes bacterium]|nr:DUF2075 domain-containing protein [Gemmatimonadota bacterium]
MIVYQSDKAGFCEDVETGEIDQILLAKVRGVLGMGVSPSEVRSWHQSLTHMHLVLTDPEIPADSGVGIEFQIPQTAKRIDVLLSGSNDEARDQAVIIELKQWETAELTPMDGIVRTVIGGGPRDTAHPSYQAWSYAELLRGFNEAVYEDDIQLHPCAFLHNYRGPGALHADFYAPWLTQAPLFVKGEVERLRDFIKKWIRYGDRSEIILRIDGGRIRPSKSLADSLAALMKGNREFTMIDEQKLVFERALHLARTTAAGEKRVLIVHGGPGTGKSVVAVNLLVALTQDRELVQYVTKNAAPRAVYEGKLTGTMSKTKYSNLFRGSGAFTTAERGTFRVLVVDEAHRLNEKSGLYQNLGDNQVKELIHAADVTVFFLDEDQRVTLQDIGTRAEIVEWAEHYDAEVEEMELLSQFRCNGSNGYLAWLDHVLGIRETAHVDLSTLDYDYDFRVFDSPNEVRRLIEARNVETNRARMVAGYCWDWVSKKDSDAWDVVIPGHDFRMQWNLTQHGSGWLAHPESAKEIGCIHTCQGLELDYVGVVIGEDLVVRDGQLVAQPEKRSRHDRSIRGYKTRFRRDPEGARAEARMIILNTYRTLMTRGLRGCYVYAVDEGVREWLRSRGGLQQ